MSAADAATLDDPTPPLPTPEQQEDALYRDVLIDITEAARDFATLLLSVAQRAHDPADILRLAAAFDRTSRCARRGILLARHLRKPAKPANDPAHPPRARPVEPPAPASATPKTGPGTAPQPPAGTLSEAAQRELRDRLDALDPTHEIALGHAPLPDAVAALHRDLKHAYDELSKPLYKPKHPPAHPPPIPDPRDRPDP